MGRHAPSNKGWSREKSIKLLLWREGRIILWDRLFENSARVIVARILGLIDKLRLNGSHPLPAIAFLFDDTTANDSFQDVLKIKTILYGSIVAGKDSPSFLFTVLLLLWLY